jgi:hypothetical protein
LGELQSDPVGRGILLRFALPIILEEIDKEADALTDSSSPFHGARPWSWDSLLQFSLDSQQIHAVKNAPVLWSILSTVAISKHRRAAKEIKEEGRDPWQVCITDALQRFALKLSVGCGCCPLHPALPAEQISCPPPSDYKCNPLLLQCQPFHLSPPFPSWNLGCVFYSQQQTP